MAHRCCGANMARNILVTVLIPRGLRRGRALRGSGFIVIDFFN